MALKGNLRDFSTTQLLSLICIAKKTGTLVVEGPGQAAYMAFHTGRLIYAQMGAESGTLPAILRKAGKINDEQVRVLKTHAAAASDKELGLLLINAGYVSQGDILSSIRTNMLDIIYRLFTWAEGMFNFDAALLPGNDKITIPIDLENVIIEGARRVREWELLVEALPTLDVALKFSDNPSDDVKNMNLTSEQWKVIPFVSPMNSMRAIAKANNLSDVDIRRIVYGLLQVGLVEVVRWENASGSAPVSAPSAGRRPFTASLAGKLAARLPQTGLLGDKAAPAPAPPNGHLQQTGPLAGNKTGTLAGKTGQLTAPATGRLPQTGLLGDKAAPTPAPPNGRLQQTGTLAGQTGALAGQTGTLAGKTGQLAAPATGRLPQTGMLGDKAAPASTPQNGQTGALAGQAGPRTPPATARLPQTGVMGSPNGSPASGPNGSASLPATGRLPQTGLLGDKAAASAPANGRLQQTGSLAGKAREPSTPPPTGRLPQTGVLGSPNGGPTGPAAAPANERPQQTGSLAGKTGQFSTPPTGFLPQTGMLGGPAPKLTDPTAERRQQTAALQEKTAQMSVIMRRLRDQIPDVPPPVP